MTTEQEIEEAKTAKAQALALASYFDGVIKRLQPKTDKRPKRDTSAITARIKTKAMKRLMKTQQA